jgi:outer membrane beta-barrel protein
LRLGYHVTENWFVEAAYASSTAGTTSFEDLSGGVQFLTDDERDFEVYDLSVGYNLNGEIFFSEGVAFNTDFYLMLGGGSTDFGGDERFTVTLGAGYRLLLTNYMALRLDVRDYVFNSDLIGEEKSTHNMAYTLGVSLFF